MRPVCESRPAPSRQNRKANRAKMTKSAQQLRGGGTSNHCAGKFGLIRHYSWRTAICSRRCKASLQELPRWRLQMAASLLRDPRCQHWARRAFDPPHRSQAQCLRQPLAHQLSCLSCQNLSPLETQHEKPFDCRNFCRRSPVLRYIPCDGEANVSWR